MWIISHLDNSDNCSSTAVLESSLFYYSLFVFNICRHIAILSTIAIFPDGWGVIYIEQNSKWPTLDIAIHTNHQQSIWGQNCPNYPGLVAILKRWWDVVKKIAGLGKGERCWWWDEEWCWWWDEVRCWWWDGDSKDQCRFSRSSKGLLL